MYQLRQGYGHSHPTQAQDGEMARVRIVRDDKGYHETETFDRRPAAAAWISKSERELSKPGAVAKSKNDDLLILAQISDRDTEETVKVIALRP